MNNQPKDAIRLTNKTARALREQAKQQRNALYVLATVVAVALCAAAVVLGIAHLIAVPICVLTAIALDALIILLARGRYLSLTGQAICTEAAARQMRGESAEEQRVKTAARDLERIKADLASDAPEAQDDDDEEDDDLRATMPVKKKMAPVRILDEEENEAQGTREVAPVSRRRRQARLQVIVSEEAHDQAN